MTRVPGPSSPSAFLRLRRILFWAHLTGGCVAGLVILLMAVTGVLLTYERQIIAGLERSAWAAPQRDASRQSVDALLAAVTRPGFEPESVTVRRNPAAPVRISAARRQRVELDPFNGEEVAPSAPRADAFFSFITALHRWFALDGDARDTGRAVTGAANLVFLGLALTGLVLWWPRIATRQAWLMRLRSQDAYPTTKARDYAWHHLLGFRFLIPIIAITITAPVFNYDWAQDALRALAGDGSAEAPDEQEPADMEWPGKSAAVEAWLATAKEAAGEWNTLTVQLPQGESGVVSVTVDRGTGAQIQHQEVLLLARDSAHLLSRTPRYARMVVRFLHTGEIFGWLGQTLAGVASLIAAVLVWTGLSLAFRRLVLTPLRRRRVPAATGASARSTADL
jgi:uncharacterized iron-regulated membrane protein